MGCSDVGLATVGCLIVGDAMKNTVSIDAQCRMYQALSTPARLHLLRIIRPDRSVKQLTALLDERYGVLAQSSISFHLRRLQDVGLIELDHKDGRRLYYRVCQSALDALRVTLQSVVIRA